MSQSSCGLTLPRALTKGKVIAVFSPSSCIQPALGVRLSRAVRALRSMGFEILLSSQVTTRTGYVAGPPESRAEGFMDLLRDPAVDGIVISIGGLNTNGVLPYLDFEVIQDNPKPIIGSSDASALLVAVNRCAKMVTYHGPTLLTHWGEYPEPFAYTVASFRAVCVEPVIRLHYTKPALRCLEDIEWRSSGAEAIRRQGVHPGWKAVRDGSRSGELIGGNVETLNCIVGTPYFPPMERPNLFFIEATGAEAFLPRFERALVHLEVAGHFEHTVGLIVGYCPDAHNVDGVSLKQVLRRLADRLEIPVAMGLDFGHSDPVMTIPIGIVAELTCDREDVSLSLLELSSQPEQSA